MGAKLSMNKALLDDDEEEEEVQHLRYLSAQKREKKDDTIEKKDDNIEKNFDGKFDIEKDKNFNGKFVMLIQLKPTTTSTTSTLYYVEDHMALVGKLIVMLIFFSCII